MRNVYFKFLVMLHILFLDITEHEWFSRSYYPTLEMNKIKENRLVVFPLMTIFQFFFLQMSWSMKKKSSKPFLMNWTRLLLKCLATKKTIQQPTLPLLLPPQFPDSYKKNFREIIFTKNLLFSLINVLLRKKINLQSRLFFLDRKLFLRYYYYPPPKTAHLIFHIL